jgi:hypothetical protein
MARKSVAVATALRAAREISLKGRGSEGHLAPRGRFTRGASLFTF